MSGHKLTNTTTAAPGNRYLSDILTNVTSDHPSPSHPVLCIFLCHTTTTFISSLTSSISLLSVLPLLPGCYILSILPPTHPASHLYTCPNHLNLTSHCVSEPSCLCCPSNILIPNPVHAPHTMKVAASSTLLPPPSPSP